MKKFFISIMFFLPIIHLLDAQVPLNLTLTFENDNLDIISPWSFDLEITNKSDSNIFAYPLLVTSGYFVEHGEVTLEKKNENDSIWENTKIIVNRSYSSGKNYRITLHPDERITSHFFCIPPMKSIKPGKIEVRASYALLEGSKQKHTISPPVTLFINEYHGDDSLAFDYLNKLAHPDFILVPLFSISGIDTSYIPYAEHLIKKYPKSSLLPYAMLYLNSMYAKKAQIVALKSKNLDEAIQYLRLSKKYGVNVLEYGSNRMREIATTVLNGLELTLFMLYDYNPPMDLEDEFTFTFKH